MGNHEYGFEMPTPTVKYHHGSYDRVVPGVTPLTPATFHMLNPTEKSDREDAERNAQLAQAEIDELEQIFNHSSEGEQ